MATHRAARRFGRFGSAVAESRGLVAAGGPFTGISQQGLARAFAVGPCGCEVGQRFCAAVPNSTGESGKLTVVGSERVLDDCLVLARATSPRAEHRLLPDGDGNVVVHPPGSAGPICITPGLQRFLPPVCNTGELPGGFSRSVGTMGPISSSITAGSSWNFQAWHRDALAGISNFTDACSVTFR